MSRRAEWKRAECYQCPDCGRWFFNPDAHGVCRRAKGIVNCGFCKHHYIDELTSGGYDYDPPEHAGYEHSCRKNHSNHTPRKLKCPDFSPIELPPLEASVEEIAQFNSSSPKWKI